MIQSQPQPFFSAILLAAGQSTRMGQFKALLPFGSKTVIESCVDTYLAAGIQNVVVVLHHQADAIKRQLREVPVDFTFNPDPKSEMSESIACGVRALPEATQAVFITPADYPAVPPTVVSALAQQWSQRQAKLLVPEYENRGGHPVLIDISFRDELLELNSKGGLRGFLEDHRRDVLRVPVNSTFIARDLDTWDDYQTLHHDVFGFFPQPVQKQI
jgi:molybdenum cofactor cytidylyltransferase